MVEIGIKIFPVSVLVNISGALQEYRPYIE